MILVVAFADDFAAGFFARDCAEDFAREFVCFLRAEPDEEGEAMIIGYEMPLTTRLTLAACPDSLHDCDGSLL